ncbi:hypothetical protein D3C78_1613790 [compost metagenome]
MKPFFMMKKTRLSESESISTRQPLAMKGISRVRGSSACSRRQKLLILPISMPAPMNSRTGRAGPKLSSPSP